MSSIRNKRRQPAIQILAMNLLLGTIGFGFGDELDQQYDMTEQNWNEDGDIEFEGIFIDDGTNSWGNFTTTDFYMQTTSANAVTDIFLPSAQIPDSSRAFKIEFDARYLTSNSHNYLSFGDAEELENAIWFGFNNQKFSAGTGTELEISGGLPSSDLVEFSRDRTFDNDTRIGVRIGYDAPNESLRNFQVDMDNNGNYETELLDEPVDFSNLGLAPENWFMVSYFGGANARIDDISLTQLDLFGDYNRDLDFDSEDIELLCGAIRDGNNELDFDQNGTIDTEDLNAFLTANSSLLADFDFNGGVEFADFLILSSAFGKTDATYGDGDVSCNGSVGFDDFLVLSANFGRYAARTPAAAAVPEPSGRLLCAIAALGFAWVRRKRQ